MFIWLLVLACAVWSLCCWGVLNIAAVVITGVAPTLALPGITRLLLHSTSWILCFPLPWLIYAGFLSGRGELTPNMVFQFAGTIFLALSILTCAVAYACLLPFGEMYFHMSPSGDTM